MVWPDDYPSSASPYYGDGETYGSELGRVSPEGNIYGSTRFVRKWRHLKWWDGAQWLDVEVSGEAESFAELPNTPRPFGQIWRVPEPDLRRSGITWVGYFWDSEYSIWKPLKWKWNVDGISNLPIPGSEIGEAHVIIEHAVPTFWNGFQWCRLRHGALENDQLDIHLPPGFLQFLTPDVRVVFSSKSELALRPVDGGSGKVIVNGEWVYAGISCSVFSNYPSIDWDEDSGLLVAVDLDPDMDYWIYLANTQSAAFGAAVDGWDFRGKLFLSSTSPTGQYLSNTGAGKCARLAGRIRTDATPSTAGGPFFERQLDISRISRTPSFSEAFRDYSDFVLTFIDQDTLKLERLYGAYGQLYIPEGLKYLGDGTEILRTDNWLSFDSELNLPVLESGPVAPNEQYYIYISQDLVQFNFNATNPATGEPWQDMDESAAGHYNSAQDFRLRPFLSSKDPEEGRFTGTYPGFYSRFIGQVRTDRNGRFIPARDLSAIRQPQLNPVYFDGLAEFTITQISDQEFRITRKQGSSGIVNVGGCGVQTYYSSDARVHKITTQDIVQSYIADRFDDPLDPAEPISSYANSELFLYMANDRDFWGTFKNKGFLSLNNPIAGYLDDNWPGNNARYLAQISPDANAKFKGSYVLNCIAPVQVLIDDNGADPNFVWSAAKTYAEICKLKADVSAQKLWDEEKASGLSASFRVKDQTHMELVPTVPGTVVAFPDLSTASLPDDGFEVDTPAAIEYIPPIDVMTSNTTPMPLVANANQVVSGYYAHKVWHPGSPNEFLMNGGASSEDPRNVSLDLGEGRQRGFMAWRIWSANSSRWNRFPVDIELDGSNLVAPDLMNDAHWTTLDSQTSIVPPDGMNKPTDWFMFSPGRMWRHYRAKVTRTAPYTDYVAFNWIEFRDLTWGPLPMTANDVPAPQLAVATSEYSDFAAWKALQWTEAGWPWTSGSHPTPSAPQSWAVKLPYAVCYKGLRYRVPTGSGNNFPTAVEVFGSNLDSPGIDNDGQWTSLAAFSSLTPHPHTDGGSRSSPLMFTNSTGYLWYRIKITAVDGGGGYSAQLNRVEFFAAGFVCPDQPGPASSPFAVTATSQVAPWYAHRCLDNGYYDDPGQWQTSARPSSESPQRLALGLGDGNEAAITRFRLIAANYSSLDGRSFPSSIQLAGSNLASPDREHDSDWTVLYTNSAVAEPGAALTATPWFEVPMNITFRWLRLSLFGAYGSTYTRAIIGRIEFRSVRGVNVYLKSDGLHLSITPPDNVYPGLKTLGDDAIWVGATA